MDLGSGVIRMRWLRSRAMTTSILKRFFEDPRIPRIPRMVWLVKRNCVFLFLHWLQLENIAWFFYRFRTCSFSTSKKLLRRWRWRRLAKRVNVMTLFFRNLSLGEPLKRVSFSLKDKSSMHNTQVVWFSRYCYWRGKNPYGLRLGLNCFKKLND